MPYHRGTASLKAGLSTGGSSAAATGLSGLSAGGSSAAAGQACRACRRAARLRLHLNVGALRISFVLLSKGDAAVWFGSIEEGGGAGIFGMLGAEGGGNTGVTRPVTRRWQRGRDRT